MFYLAIDQSTQGTKILLVSNNKVMDRMDKKHIQLYPQKDWVEHNPMEIYTNTVGLIESMLAKHHLNYSDISGISLTNQRETVVVWDYVTGKPIHNALVWQCKRAESICQKLKDDGYSEVIRQKTGLIIDPYFSGPKLKWMFENNEEYCKAMKDKTLRIGTIDTWLLWNLTERQSFYSEPSNASRTMLYNINEMCWDKTLLEVFSVSKEALPEVINTNSTFGAYKGIPIISMIADSQASLYANKCLSKGSAKATLGTGCSIMAQNESSFSGNYQTLVETVAWSTNDGDSFAVEGVIRSLGDTIEWAKNELGLFDDVGETLNRFDNLNSLKVYVIPSQLGLGTPYWISDIKASIHGLTRTSTSDDIIKAFFLSVLFQIKDVIDEIGCQTGVKIEQLRLDGGLTRSNLLMQNLANLLQVRIQVSKTEELSAMGALLIANVIDFEIQYSEFKPFVDNELEESYKDWKRLMPKRMGDNK